MKTIAIVSPNSGTGKTMTTYAMCRSLTQRGFKILAVDMDWQSVLTTKAGIDPYKAEVTLYDLFMRKTTPSIRATQRTRDGFDIIPSSFQFILDENSKKVPDAKILKEILAHFEAQYDYCIIDTPPFLASAKSTPPESSPRSVTSTVFNRRLPLPSMPALCGHGTSPAISKPRTPA